MTVSSVIAHYGSSHAIVASLSLAICFLVGRVVYNVYFHPLRSYPGPLLGRATVLYSIYLEYSGILHLKTKEWHDKYGEAVRVAPNMISYNSDRAWDTICGHRANGQGSFDKDQAWFVKSPNGKFSLVAENGDKHRRLRRLLAHAFSEKALKAQEILLQGYVDLFISRLRDRSAVDGGVVDMMHWFNFTTFDIIGDLAFGECFGLLESGVWSRYISSIFGTLQFGVYYRSVRRTLPTSWQNFVLARIAPKKVGDDRKYLYDVSRSKMKVRTSIDTERKDFGIPPVHYMLKGSKEAIGDDGLSFDEMVAQGQLLIVAGSETTATTLSGMLYYLLRNPSCLSRLTDEIRSSFASEEDINLLTTQRLKYLPAVLEESLRIYPPVPNTLPRVTPNPGMTICDRFVPAGTVVGINHYSSSHSAANFFEPDSFHPERWLDGDDKDARFNNDKKGAFHPFSHGPRNCLGKNLAYAELRLIVSKFFWNFDVELQPESRNWTDQRTTTLWMKHPLMIKLLPRPVS